MVHKEAVESNQKEPNPLDTKSDFSLSPLHGKKNPAKREDAFEPADLVPPCRCVAQLHPILASFPKQVAAFVSGREDSVSAWLGLRDG